MKILFKLAVVIFFTPIIFTFAAQFEDCGSTSQDVTIIVSNCTAADEECPFVHGKNVSMIVDFLASKLSCFYCSTSNVNVQNRYSQRVRDCHCEHCWLPWARSSAFPNSP